MKYFDENGTRLVSLFDGIEAMPGSRIALAINLTEGAAGCRARQKRSISGNPFVNVDDPGDCNDACAGAYMIPRSYPCYSGCNDGGGSYYWFYSDPETGYPDYGWQYMGVTCHPCDQCREIGCYALGDPE